MGKQSIIHAIEKQFKITFKDVSDERNGCQVQRVPKGRMLSKLFTSIRIPTTVSAITVTKDGYVRLSTEDDVQEDHPDKKYADAQVKIHNKILKAMQAKLPKDKIKLKSEFKQSLFFQSNIESFIIKLEDFIEVLGLEKESPYQPNKKRDTILNAPEAADIEDDFVMVEENLESADLSDQESQFDSAKSSASQDDNENQNKPPLPKQKPKVIQPNPKAFRESHIELLESLGQYTENNKEHVQLAQRIYDLIPHVKSTVKDPKDYYPALWSAIKIAISEYETDVKVTIDTESDFYQDLLSEKMDVFTANIYTKDTPAALRFAASVHRLLQQVDMEQDSQLEHDWEFGGLLSSSDGSEDLSESLDSTDLTRLREELNKLSTIMLMNQEHTDAKAIYKLLEERIFSSPNFNNLGSYEKPLKEIADTFRLEALQHDIKDIKDEYKNHENNNAEKPDDFLSKIDILIQTYRLDSSSNKEINKAYDELKKLKDVIQNNLDENRSSRPSR